MRLIGLTRAVALRTLIFTLSATPTWSQTILSEKISEVIKIKNPENKKISVLNYLLYKILSFKNITHSILILLLSLGNSIAFGQLPKQSNHITQYAQNTRRYTISGTIELINLYGIAGQNNNCFGTSGYQDIRGGTQIIIKDGSGKVLAIGKTSNGRRYAGQYSQHICRFTFKISNISRTNFYSIKIGRRGEIFYSYQDLAKQNWNVNLTLGASKNELEGAIRILEDLNNTSRSPIVSPFVNQTIFSAIDYYNRGIVYHDQQKWDLAVADYTQTIRLNPNYADAYYNRALVYYNQQKWDLALADYTQAIRLNPNDAQAYYNRGIVYHDQQKWDLAVADYTQAIRLNPNYANAYYNRALVYYNQKKWDLALADYTQAIRLNPNLAQAYYNRALVYYNQQKWDLALADYTQAIAINPNDANAYYNRGLVYRNQQKWDLAVADYNKAIALDRNYASCAPKWPGVRLLSNSSPNDIHPQWQGENSIGISWSLITKQMINTDTGIYLKGDLYSPRGGLINENIFVIEDEWFCNL
jgi:tetratricopeptide (TPR) repeat protein